MNLLHMVSATHMRWHRGHPAVFKRNQFLCSFLLPIALKFNIYSAPWFNLINGTLSALRVSLLANLNILMLSSLVIAPSKIIKNSYNHEFLISISNLVSFAPHCEMHLQGSSKMATTHNEPLVSYFHLKFSVIFSSL